MGDEKKTQDEPAFPIAPYNYTLGNAGIGGFTGAHGLTKREHFAGLAMQALTTNAAYSITPWEEIAKRSVIVADALLAALKG